MSRTIKKQLTLNASQERAFRVFTEGIDRWWPREHHIGSSPLKREVIEPKLNGRWYGLSEDGTECEVGKVLEWQPFSKLALTWQITSDWKYDASFITVVEVRFTAEGPKKTRIDFEHRELERYGASETANQLEKGWSPVIDRFGKQAEQEESA
jgi:uncharacterized protein YndB with AHSA1/START domain